MKRTVKEKLEYQLFLNDIDNNNNNSWIDNVVLLINQHLHDVEEHVATVHDVHDVPQGCSPIRCGSAQGLTEHMRRT